MGAEVQTEEAKLADAWVGKDFKCSVSLSIRKGQLLAGEISPNIRACCMRYLFYHMR